MENFPVWTVVLAIIGLLVNLLVGLMAWAINGKLADLRQTIEKLSAADEALSEDYRALARDLNDHKLYAANHYARATDVAAIFSKIDGLRADLLREIKDLIEKVNDRIDAHHPPHGGK